MKLSTSLSTLFATSVAVAVSSLPAQALTFSFSGSSSGGTGSAEMTFSGLGTKSVMVDLFNNSSTKLDNGTGFNAPAITGFGFNHLGEPDPAIQSWELKALDSSNKLVTIGSSNDKGWGLQTNKSFGGDFFDYLVGAFNKGGNQMEIKGGIYNAALMGSNQLAAAPNYFSKASLSLNFASNFTLDKASTYVRMQNVGAGGEGSLKLTGVEKPPVKEVPEPLTILGSAAALGFAARFKKQADKNKAIAKDTTLV